MELARFGHSLQRRCERTGSEGMTSGCCCPDSNNVSCLAADFAERDELLFQGQYHSRQSRRRQDSDGCNLRAGASVRGRE